MNTSFRDTLPKSFVTNTISLCGDRGERWLDGLPKIISKLAGDWDVEVHDHFKHLSYNYVASATTKDGDAAVLKIGLPLDDIEIFGEAKYLREIGGNGAVRLLREDRKAQSVLIERAVRGLSLKKVFKKDPDAAVAAAINVLKRLLRPPPKQKTDTISLDDWFDGLTRYPETDFPAEFAKKALKFYAELSPQPGRTFYLHGDLHHSNILEATREDFLAIDPKGMIGHVGYEIGVFLNNHHWWLDRDRKLKSRLSRAIELFAAAFEIDPIELRKWAYAQMVLSAWWMFDEMNDIYDDEVEMADIWGV